jgi:hypothetical protein
MTVADERGIQYALIITPPQLMIGSCFRLRLTKFDREYGKAVKSYSCIIEISLSFLSSSGTIAVL